MPTESAPIGAPQPGILAFGTTHHAYLEFDLTVDASTEVLRGVVGALDESLVTGAGSMAVVGFRPEMWAKLVPEHVLPGLAGFNRPLRGLDDFTMPATQHDVAIWVQGGAQDAVFDLSRTLINAVSPWATLADETEGWVYHHHRDLTGFVDGTENPHLSQLPGVVQVPDGPAAGGSVLLLQRWPHDVQAWEGLPVAEQEKVIGRTKESDTEFDPKPPSSHIARTDQDDLGDILRRNTAFGTAGAHGTMFVGIGAGSDVMQKMLDQMAGVDGLRDALTFYSHPETGGYYYLPSVEQLDPYRPDLSEE
ncbi:Dyp-type peroxidase [Propionibacterium freudenreichii]|jgi:putative iron-dependent peroxidase|uniref:Dyp-type peroxidase n=1 Tax=Propionibacterium freudenreichii TaxID=1744 RepID=UPI0004A0132E|nr:Dyp-type peroxidase [Propionibacterium freudenreichii]AWY96782.1 Dyp-type peroxidase family protein [Propionibacterium freudenreichii]MCT2974577.1 Dyp-type peroxidase [Propionibacterium freudenreichii]MDK9646495.1 Dyp-type peroxidase [Propionibacterium freudenreichii]MDK9666302.1 Dyp-type peroxidase [Propionibacterium freudenreichii]WBF59672.1 Dyp-type peroxidase [Propionibacterium freudenreichii]